MRAIVDRKGLDRHAASTSQMGRFETEWLATRENLAALTNLSGIWIDRVHDRKKPKIIILDMDSSESPAYGDQEGRAAPRALQWQLWLHLLPPALLLQPVRRPGALPTVRPGNVHSAEDWRAPAHHSFRGSPLLFLIV